MDKNNLQKLKDNLNAYQISLRTLLGEIPKDKLAKLI